MIILSRRKRFVVFSIHVFVWGLWQIYRLFDHTSSVKNDKNTFKILVLELWGIGDVILSVPFLSSLRKKYPEAEIVLLAKKYASDILMNSDLGVEVIPYEIPWTKFKGKYRFWQWDLKSLFALIKKLRERHFDMAFDARMDFRNNILLFLTSAKRRIGYGHTGGGYLLTDIVQVDFRTQHRIDEWINILNYLDIPINRYKPKLLISEEESNWRDQFLAEKNITKHDFIFGIHPGAGALSRCWPLERFARVAEYVRGAYNAKIVVFVDPNDYGVDISIKGTVTLLKLPLRQFIILAERMNLFICNDSGAMHIASALSLPQIAIFGPGNMRAIGPRGIADGVMIKKEYSCRPCYDYCKYKEPYCLTRITIEDVLKAIDDKMNSMVSNTVTSI